VRSLVLSKAEGNPFFMEEVVRALIDMRALVRDRTSGAWRSTAEVSRITIPATIEGIIMARVDHLAEPVKTTLKLASVIGRQFRAGVLRVIGTEPHADIDAHLAELQRLDFIREREGRSDVEYVFKHAIIQGVVYDSILASRRQELHRQVAMAIEQLFAGRLDDLYGLLAYHYARAELWERAQHYLFNAGDQAVRVAADVETLAHYRDALAAYEQAFGTSLAPLQRAQLDRKMGEALFRRGDHEQALEYLQRAVRALGIRYPRTWLGTRCFLLGHLVIQLAHRAWPALLVRGGDSDPVAVELSRTCQAIGWIDYFIDQERFVLDCLIELNVSERGGYQEGAVSGQMATGVVLDHLGLLSLSRGYHRRGMALAEKLQRPIGLAFAHFGLAMHEHHALGELTSALSHYRHAADAWHELGDLRRWGASVYSMAWIQRLLGDVEPSLEQAQALIRVGEESADQHVLAWGHHGRGRVLYQIGDLAGAIDHLQRAIALFLSVPDYHFAQCATSDLGRCHLQAGDVETARAHLSEALATIATRKFRGFLSVPAFTGMAEVCLAEAERAAPGRGAALAGAKRACTLALQKARQTPEWTPVASRLRGTFECLAGEPAAAWRWWQESLNTATRLGLRHEVGLTHLESGRRTGRDDHIDQATKILTSVGASRVLWRTLSELALGQ
jgi:tetratricopeptide (TPR) repeat protein